MPTGWAAAVPVEVLSAEYRLSYVPSGSMYARLRRQHRALQGKSQLALGDPTFALPRRAKPPAQGVLLTYVHPAGSAICSPFIIDYNYGGSVGTSLEDATFVLHMIAKQIPYRYPRIKFIVPHLGGPIPMVPAGGSPCATSASRAGRSSCRGRTWR